MSQAINLAKNSQQEQSTSEFSLEKIIILLRAACKAQEWSKITTKRALRGLTGYICGNYSIQTAIDVLEKLPLKYAKKIAKLIEIGIGNYDTVENSDNDKYVITQGKTPILTYDKKTGWNCIHEELNSKTRKIRIACYKQLCKRRKELPENWMEAKIVSYTTQQVTYASKKLAALKNLAKQLEKNRQAWQGAPESFELREFLEWMQSPSLSAKDTRPMAHTSNITGTPIPPIK